MDLLKFTSKGIYCKQADVYIDPWKPVNKALITHGHSDHSRYGHQSYLTVKSGVPVIKYRLGNIKITGVQYGEQVAINGVKFSFHPAGHIIGSAQIRVEYRGEVWVVTGDYKTENDGISEPFELVKCNTMITESTFGLPVFKWESQKDIIKQIDDWWISNKNNGRISILSSYALGKAQRIIQNINHDIGKVWTHGAIENTNEVLRDSGFDIKQTYRITPEVNHKDIEGGLIIATPSGINSNWGKKFKNASIGIASGWMAMRGARRRRGADRGFVLSDHADWTALNKVIKESEAERVIVTHGYTDIFSKWLNEQGIETITEKTAFVGESIDQLEPENIA